MYDYSQLIINNQQNFIPTKTQKILIDSIELECNTISRLTRQAGFTTANAIAALLKALNYSNKSIGILSPKNIVSVAFIDLINNIITKSNLSHKVIRTTKNIIEFDNGSIISIVSLNTIIGRSFDFLILEIISDNSDFNIDFICNILSTKTKQFSVGIGYYVFGSIVNYRQLYSELVNISDVTLEFKTIDNNINKEKMLQFLGPNKYSKEFILPLLHK